VRVFEPTPYDREVLAADLRSAGSAETLELRAAGPVPAEFERTLVQARLAGVDVHMDPAAGRPDRGGLTEPGEVRSWTVGRLIARSLALADELGAERDAPAGDGDAAADERGRRRAATDESLAAFRAVIEAYLDVVEDSRSILHAVTRELGRLTVVRAAVDARTVTEGETHDAYDAIADAILCYAHALQSVVAWTCTRLPPRRVETSSRLEPASRVG
jgi:hypothetical protein